LENVTLFDVYEGEHIAEGKKSLALRLRLRLPNKTLTEDEITQTVDKIVGRVGEQFGAILRS
jgi:phenylalanyl-tRNA synthetase beta chain